MNPQGHTLFATSIGCCGLAWGERGIVGVQLPQADETRTRERLAHRFPASIQSRPPVEIAQIAAAIVALLAGEPDDLTRAVLDEQGLPEFDRAAYAIARSVPPGATTTYGEIANAPNAAARKKLIAALPKLCALGYPILIGASRKSFVRRIAGAGERELEFGTAAVNAIAIANGAK